MHRRCTSARLPAGVVCDDISSAVSEVRSGSYQVVEQRHTVLLGWNRHMRPLINQVRGAGRGQEGARGCAQLL